MVQRRAARWVTGRYHNTSSVSDILRSLDRRSLEQRRVDSWLSMLFKIRYHLVAIDEESCLKKRYWKKRASVPPVESRQRLYTFLFLSHDSNTVEQSRWTPSRLRSRSSSTQDSINLKNIFYLFVFLHLFFLLSFSVLSVPTHLFHSPIFSVSHSTGENPQNWGHTSISAKAEKKSIAFFFFFFFGLTDQVEEPFIFFF